MGNKDNVLKRVCKKLDAIMARKRAGKAGYKGDEGGKGKDLWKSQRQR